MMRDQQNRPNTGGLARKGLELQERPKHSGLLTAAEEYGDFMDVHCETSIRVTTPDALHEWNLMRDGTLWTASENRDGTGVTAHNSASEDLAALIRQIAASTDAGRFPTEENPLRKDWDTTPQPGTLDRVLRQHRSSTGL